ncbi:MAG: hypothetical protein ACKPKO_47145, partial [Candidatus Fonsibacter sp.]
MDNPAKKSLLRLREDDLPTAARQVPQTREGLVHNLPPVPGEDIMRNFGKLVFNNYLDSHEDLSVWNAPRLIAQLDSLMHIFERSDDALSGEGFQLRYDMIILDESESLLAHFDEQTMSGKEIGVCHLFNNLLHHSGHMLLMVGVFSDSEMTYINN